MRRRITKILCLLLAVIGTVSLALNNTALAYSPQKRLVPIYRTEGREGRVGLSFDAAWGADKTADILDQLDFFGVKCTFFLVTFWVEKYPELVVEIVKRGHEIGTHSSTHPDMTKLTAEQITQELAVCCQKIKDVCGYEVTLFRPPFGAYNNRLIETAQNLGLITIQWDVDTLDWKGISAKDVAMRASRATSGSIILCHNNSDNIVDAVPLIINMLQSKGLTAQPIGELIYRENYYIDNNGCQRPIQNVT